MSGLIDIWPSVVSVCSGRNWCQFNLELAKGEDNSRSWGPGQLSVRYSCQGTAAVSSYCGGILDVSAPGYISSPAYPNYYLGGRDCVWTLAVGEGQRLMLTILDLSLRGAKDGQGSCQDSVVVAHNDEVLVDVCGELDQPKVVVAEGREVEVKMKTESNKQQQLYPRRGVLIKYTPVGCATPAAPADGFMLDRNGSHAQLSCNSGHVFTSTLTSSKIISCRYRTRGSSRGTCEQ